MGWQFTALIEEVGSGLEDWVANSCTALTVPFVAASMLLSVPALTIISCFYKGYFPSLFNVVL